MKTHSKSDLNQNFIQNFIMAHYTNTASQNPSDLLQKESQNIVKKHYIVLESKKDEKKVRFNVEVAKPMSKGARQAANKAKKGKKIDWLAHAPSNKAKNGRYVNNRVAVPLKKNDTSQGFGAIAAKMWCSQQEAIKKANADIDTRSFNQKQDDYIKSEMDKFAAEQAQEEEAIEAWMRENPDEDDLEDLWDEMISTYEPIYLDPLQELSEFTVYDGQLVPSSITFGYPGRVLQASM